MNKRHTITACIIWVITALVFILILPKQQDAAQVVNYIPKTTATAATTAPEVLERTQPTPLDLGEYTLTAYCPCYFCCGKTDGITYTGSSATSNHTVAVDPSVIALGSTLIINHQEYTAEDIGGAIKGNKIDIYFDTHQEALDFGVQTMRVYILK